MSNTLSDITVKLNVETPSVPVNMGNLALFVKGDKQNVEGFNSYEDLQKVYGSNDLVKQVANGYFSQDDHGNKLFVITYTDVATAATDYYGEGWEFATVIPGVKVVAPSVGDQGKEKEAVTVDTTNDLADTVALSNFIDGKKERFAVVGLPATNENVEKISDTKKAFGNSPRTIIFVSGTNQAEAEYGIGGLVGAVGNETVGSVTWKFRKIGGVKPVDLTVTQIQKLHENNAFTYVTKAALDQTSEGKTLSGEFIDALHGDDWVKASLETELQKLLSNSKKITFDSAGIAQIDATVTAVLTTATNNGIISENPETKAGEFSVYTASRAESSDEDVAQRNYTGLKFSYTRSGAIHTVKVNGQINI
ncbi:hypothetical protein A3Q05_04835 [Lactobacillus johnsonii]|uniref:DUF3383 family protein n=1 Tax=Lactobacillus johnsonii TaxID=33959 RepID=A0A267M892_LACJH|nr:DUF3383 family protein [Lactobacillus johnsonii]PAB55513.1 hypothetical protein A3Q05_04835 [Lactobacillus johnsonii]PAB55804.1 hypothetical protein A3Q24_03550 [Lactobacillus johnsonii]PEG68893.1 DUF3383 domain-containing protein [Lactobacillus johnsonii]